MFDVERSHQEILARIASLERILLLLTPDVEPLIEAPRRDSERRAEALARRSKRIHAVK